MSKHEKAIEKLRQNPKNVRFEEIETILLHLDFIKRQNGTSHAIFRLGNLIINVPKRKPFVKPVYVEKVLEVIDILLESNSSED